MNQTTGNFSISTRTRRDVDVIGLDYEGKGNAGESDSTCGSGESYDHAMIAFDILEKEERKRKFGGVGRSLSRFETEACYFQVLTGYWHR